MKLRYLALACCLGLVSPARAEEVIVFAAASLKTALDEVARTWEAESGHRVTISYAGSGALAKQIIDGAPADLFLSAAENWMDVVAEVGLVAVEGRKDLLSNRLVLIAHDPLVQPVAITPDLDLAAMLGDGKLSMAMLASVPAGQYGKAALQSLGLWDSVAGAVVQRDNVRSALALVEAGEAPLGIVYETDAAASDRVRVVGVFPAESHPPIVYPLALLTNANDPADRAFFEALSAEEAMRTFARYGFGTPAAKAQAGP